MKTSKAGKFAGAHPSNEKGPIRVGPLETLFLPENSIMPLNTQSAMIPVPQPSCHLAHAYWGILEIQLLAAMLGAAAEQRAAQKGRVQP